MGDDTAPRKWRYFWEVIEDMREMATELDHEDRLGQQSARLRRLAEEIERMVDPYT